MKNLYYGILHAAIALTSVLLVSGLTGINLAISFITVGLGTIVFNLITKRKIAAVLGVSGSYTAGMIYIGSTLGPAYAAGGVVMAGLIYLILGAAIKKWPSLLNLMPKYILNTAVLLIALTLMPVGASMITGSPVIALVTIVALITAQLAPKLRPYTLPFGLVVGTLASIGNVNKTVIDVEIALTIPAFSWAAFTMIGVVAIAVVFETIGNAMTCTNAQGEDLDIGSSAIGAGVASVISGCLGGLPLTIYSENAGFLYMSGWFDPTAQIVTGAIYVAMGLIPGVASMFAIIPPVVYGAILVFLFALIAANAVKDIDFKEDNLLVMVIMILAFYVTPVLMPNFSPIAAAIILGMVSNFLIDRFKR